NLSNANLSYANWHYANLSNADLRYANVSFIELMHTANLSGANVSPVICDAGADTNWLCLKPSTQS
ncbi:MAG TPA: pentapeptide repeat-containing protein, partial [Candidatus Obscuribacterales bacterium]